MEDNTLSIKETANIINRSTQTVYKYILDGKLKAVKLGKSYYIELEELRRFVNNTDLKIGDLKKPECEYYSVKEIADFMNLDVVTIRRYILYGINGIKLKAQKINKIWLIYKKDYEDFINNIRKDV
jgi:excisionase family DNA binding protein